jgi:hypothetical protein
MTEHKKSPLFNYLENRETYGKVCCPILTKIGMCRQFLVKVSDMKFHDNLFSSSRVVTYGRTD